MNWKKYFITQSYRTSISKYTWIYTYPHISLNTCTLTENYQDTFFQSSFTIHSSLSNLCDRLNEPFRF